MIGKVPCVCSIALLGAPLLVELVPHVSLHPLFAFAWYRLVGKIARLVSAPLGLAHLRNRPQRAS